MNTRKEITDKLKSLFTEQDVLETAKDVLVQKINTSIPFSVFSQYKQQYNESFETIISKIKDAAIPCNFRQMCASGCDKYVDYTDQMVCDQLLVGMHNKPTKTKAIQKWNSDRETGMTLSELIEMCITIETGKNCAGRWPMTT